MQSHNAWHDRLGWAFDLIAEDSSDRFRAHVRLMDRQRLYSEAFQRYNQVFRNSKQPNHPKHRALLAAVNQAEVNALPGALSNRVIPGALTTWDGLPYGLLYLRWEAMFPHEWRAYAKSWGIKKDLLRLFVRRSHEMPRKVADELIDLITLVVRREHHCEDIGYARLARALDGPRLRTRLAKIADQPVEPACLRAGYLLWVLDHPDASRPNKGQWLSWLSSHDR